jgi:hypothetical protein
MKFIKTLKSLKFIFMPHYWIMTNSYNKSVDTLINKLLDRYEFTDIKPCTAMLGEIEIWIENVPYGAIRIRDSHLGKVRPSRLTVHRALCKLKKAKQREINIMLNDKDKVYYKAVK